MVRTLPWKRTTTTSTRSVSSRPRTPPAAKTRPIKSETRFKSQVPPSNPAGLDDTSDGDGDGPGPSPEKPAPEPVQESFMIEGPQQDDMWRMVEDEFLATAHKFTAHLHAAEYRRLKKLAKDQNADAIQSLSRPVVGPMTDDVRRQRTVLDLHKLQAAGIKRARKRSQQADDDDADELPWAGTNLQELMDSPRKKPTPLTTLLPVKSGTRAAALDQRGTVHSRQPSPSRERSDRQARTAPRTTSADSSCAKSVQFHDSDGSTDYDEDLDKGSRPVRPAARIQTTSLHQQTSRTLAATRGKSPAYPITTKKSEKETAQNTDDDDSDSSVVETMFERHLKERRNQRRLPRQRTPSTQDTAPTHNEPSQTSQGNKALSSLSIPPF